MGGGLLCIVSCLSLLYLSSATTVGPGSDLTDSTILPPTTPTPSLPVIPGNALAPLGKLPGGLQNALLALVLGGGSVDMTTLLQVFTSLPSLLNNMDQTNRTGLSEEDTICYEDTDYLAQESEKGSLWTMSMMDASGKPGPSLMRGAFKFEGRFEQCLDVESPPYTTTGRTVRGDTCVVYINPPAAMYAASMIPPETPAFNLEWHICLPDTRSGPTIGRRLNSTLSQAGLTINSVVCHRDIKVKPLGENARAIGALVLTAILGSLVFLGTALDLYIRAFKAPEPKPFKATPAPVTPVNSVCAVVDTSSLDKSLGNGHINNLVPSEKTDGDVKLTKYEGPQPEIVVEVNGFSNGHIDAKILPECKKKPDVAPIWVRLLLCFSAVSNGERILSVKNTPGSLTCLNGIRVLSMGWVILGHSMTFPMGIADDPLYINELKQTLGFQMIINGTLSVDSFFVLSGLLVTYLFLKETEKKGGVTPKQMVLYYVHRYLRLTPALAFMIFFHISITQYLTDGPVWMGAADNQYCEDNWWKNILYINNLFNNDGLCFGVSWFLSNDMQFYVIAPLALVPLAYRHREGYGRILRLIGLGVIVALILTSIITTAYLVYTIDEDITTSGTGDYFMKVYIKPWCRVGTFAIGAGVGYILHSTKSKIKIPVFLQGVVWIVAMTAMLAITLVTYDQHGPDRTPWETSARTAHETLFRPVWGLVLGWVIIMCCSGKGGVIDYMLSWAWWQPLARLTYGAYLIHPILMSTDMNRIFKFTVTHLMYMNFGYTCLSYIAAFLLAILVEAPMLQLEKLLLSK